VNDKELTQKKRTLPAQVILFAIQTYMRVLVVKVACEALLHYRPLRYDGL